MPKNLPLISIIVPIYNEADNIPKLYETLKGVVEPLPYQVEFIFIDDGSKDHSSAEAGRLAQTDDNIQVIEFARNFGKEIAITAGLEAAKGQAAIMIDADLQHPPELIPEFIAKWEAGADVVVGVYRTNGHRAWFKQMAAKLFYAIMRAISRTDIIANATDYRLIDRVVIDEFNRFTERNRLTRGLIDWLGFERDYVYFKPNPRLGGQAAYSIAKLVNLAVHSIIGHSLLPLRLAGYLGSAIVVTSGSLGLFIYIEKFILGDPIGYNFSGPAMLAVITVFLSGITLSCLGLIALYIADIHDEVVGRPLYVVRRRRTRRGEEPRRP